MSRKVSIIVNFHNSEKYLDNCIRSILAQDYQNFEIILWDNSSTDNSKKIVENFNDERIKYFFNKEKSSLYKARNQAIKASNSDLIAFLDSDDWWEKDYLSSRENIFNNTNYDYFYCNVNLYYEKNQKKKRYKNFILPNGKIYNFLAKDYFIIISGLIIRRKIIEQFGTFDENFNIIGDFDYVMKISKKLNAHSVSKPLVFYRYHENNFSKKNTKMFFDEFNNWFNKQLKIKDIDFLNNINFFKKKLLQLEINYLLIDCNKNFYLFKKILNYPNLFKKIKYLVAFFTPKKIINFIR